MKAVNEDTRAEVEKLVKEFFAEECEIDVNDITDSTRIVEDLDGDSLMFLSFLEIIRKRYGVNVEIKTIGKRLMREPAETIAQIIDLTLLLIEKGEEAFQ